MKNFLQNLLIFFALCLCGLIAYQWVRETHLRKSVQDLTDAGQTKAEAILNQQATIRRDEAEVQRLDGLRKELIEVTKSNQTQIVALTKSLDKATNEIPRLERQIEVYKDAVQTANNNITKQNEEIKKQNEDMKALADDRNEVVKKFNKMAADYNDLATKWNKQQEELAKAATNTPPTTAKK